MAVKPHTIDIVVSDMGKSLAFYRALGLDAPQDAAHRDQVQIATPGGATLGLISEALMHQTTPEWIEPIGQRVTFACRCDTPQEVDAVFAAMTQAGYAGQKDPWYAVWGQRYACLQDPDNNRVDLFAAITEDGRE